MTQPPPGDRYQQYPQYPPTGAYAQQQPPPNWGAPQQPQKPPAIQDEIRRGLATTRGKLIAVALVVAAIVTITVVAVVGSKVAFADDIYPIGDGVEVSVDVPDGWKALTAIDPQKSLILVPESEQRPGNEISQSVNELLDGDTDGIDSTQPLVAVLVTSFPCDRARSELGDDGVRVDDWIESRTVSRSTGDFEYRTRVALHAPASCEGWSWGATAIDASVGDSTPGTAGTDIVEQIARGKVVTRTEG